MFAKVEGVVRFERKGRDKNVSVYPIKTIALYTIRSKAFSFQSFLVKFEKENFEVRCRLLEFN